MKASRWNAIVAILATCLSQPLVGKPQSTTSVTTSPAAVTWIDKDTGHRVVQITPEQNSKGLYFNLNAFTPDGTQMVYTAEQGVYVVDLNTHKSRQLISGSVSSMIVGKKSPTVYFVRPDQTALYLTRIDTGETSKIAELPKRATVFSLNSDETLIAGTYTEVDLPPHPVPPTLPASSIRATQMDARLAAHIPMVLFTYNLTTGETRTVIRSRDWLNHILFSPTDPTLLMYCHEGLWYRVDRIWTIRTDGTQNTLIHKRTMNYEIAGHEFWDADGKTIWYDLQIPRGQNFYLASYNTATGARKWYSLDRDSWSIHFNAKTDDSLFCGDGGDYAQVAKSRNGTWIDLYSPRESSIIPEVDQTGLTNSGFFVVRHLVNMAHHNYTLEPNVRFSPDGKSVLFTSNILGASHVYAVDIVTAAKEIAGAE